MLTSLAVVARDLDHRGYPYAAVVRDAARRLAQLDQGDDDAPACQWCRAPLPTRSVGRPPVYCSKRCRQAAFRAKRRNSDESRMLSA